jgi:hypothetical protein
MTQHLSRFIGIVVICTVAASATYAPSATALEQLPAALVGTWTGIAYQNKGTSNYTVVMTISAKGAATEYPQLKCGGMLARVGESGGYVFFTETIRYGGQSSGGGCVDGTITVAPAGDKLAWGWMGSFGGETYVAWSTLTRK